MSEWRRLIDPTAATWSGVVAYAEERIQALTAVCINPKSTGDEIRQAQAGIEELERLKAAPDSIKATAQFSDRGNRKGY